jgi:hypothetical protein
MMIGDSLLLAEGSAPFHEAEKQWNGRFKVRFLRAVMARCVVRKARD